MFPLNFNKIGKKCLRVSASSFVLRFVNHKPHNITYYSFLYNVYHTCTMYIKNVALSTDYIILWLVIHFYPKWISSYSMFILTRQSYKGFTEAIYLGTSQHCRNYNSKFVIREFLFSHNYSITNDYTKTVNRYCCTLK